MSEENEKKRKTPTPVIDITLPDDEDDYNRPFSPLSEHESEEHVQKHSRKETIEAIESDSNRSDDEEEESSEKRIDEDDEDGEGGYSDDEIEIIDDGKKEKGRKSRSTKQSLRLPPSMIAEAQSLYAARSSDDKTFQVMYTPLNIESRIDPTTNNLVEYSIGFITVAVKEVSEDQFLTYLYAAHNEINNSRIHFSNVDMKHCCEPARSISYVGKLFIDAGISKARVVELVSKARKLAVPSAESGEKQLLFVAIRMPSHLMNCVQSPILSYNLRVRIVSERIVGGGSFLADATRCAALGFTVSHDDLKPLVLTNDELHRYTLHTQPSGAPRCNENLPIFSNTAFDLEALSILPIAIYLPSPTTPVVQFPTRWHEVDPHTVDGFVAMNERNLESTAELTENERISLLFRAVDQQDNRVGWRPPERFVAAKTQAFLIAPQSSRNVTARLPSNMRRPSWVQTPIDRFDRGEIAMFSRSPVVVTGPCHVKDGDDSRLNVVTGATVQRALTRFKKNMQLRHTKKINMRISNDKMEISDHCLETIKSSSNVSVWLNAMLETDKKLKPMLSRWTTRALGRNEDEVRFNALYQIVRGNEAYLDANGWPTDALVRHFSFAAAAYMSVEFWLIAMVLSFDTAMVCLLRGVVGTVHEILKSNCPHNLLTLATLTANGPAMDKLPVQNFIRNRAIPRELDSVALLSFATCVLEEAPWQWDLVARLTDPESRVARFRHNLDVLRYVSVLFSEESEAHVDYHSAFVANHLLNEADFKIAAHTNVRVIRADESFDGLHSNAIFQTIQANALCDAFCSLFSPTDGPFKARGIEVVRCETRNEHDRSLVIVAARVSANQQDLVVWCDDSVHVQLAVEALGRTFRSLVVFGDALHQFLTTDYQANALQHRIMLMTQDDLRVVPKILRCVARARARLCFAYAHRYPQPQLVTILNALTSSKFVATEHFAKNGVAANKLISRDEAKLLVAAHWGSEYEANIPGVRLTLDEWREAGICGDELMVIGLPLTPWSACDPKPARRGASIVDDLFFAASSCISFDTYCDDSFAEPAPFLRAVSCEGGFLAIFNDPAEGEQDQFMGGEQSAIIGETKVRFFMRNAELFGVDFLPDNLKHVGVYLPPENQVQLRLTLTDLQYETTAAGRTMTLLPPNAPKTATMRIDLKEWATSGFVVVDHVPSSTFVTSAPMFKGNRAADALTAVAQLRRKLNETVIDQDEVDDIISRAKLARNPSNELGSMFDVDAKAWSAKISEHIAAGRVKLDKRIKAHQSLMQNARILKSGISIDTIMALFFYEPPAVVWHGDMTESLVHRFNARMSGFSFNKTPLEKSMSEDEFPNWYNSYMLCANSPLPYVLGALFDSRTII